jgi:asparagine synthase (glutamine-hydrolysing)
MCGITGQVDFRRDMTMRPDVIERMTAELIRRGPDAGATWVRPRVALGHRRLSVIDPVGGAQPMTETVPEGEVALTYSGEVYNFRSLRDELRRRGHPFRTASDTEVVLRAYLEWGEGLVEHLIGMYAFAVWDGRTERLLLVRDRLGIKPLYYYPTEDGLLFGSEPKAILANPDASARVGLDGLREIYTGVKRPGVAIFEDMRELLPATVLTLDRDGCRQRAYWELTVEDDPAAPADPAAAAERTRALLSDIVADQLVADVPLCALLSGGLDSSAVTALAAARSRAEGSTIRSFSVDFAGHTENFTQDWYNVSPDAPFVRDLVAHVGHDHRSVVLDVARLADPAVREAAVTARDMPVGLGDMDNSLYLLFQAIREESTVALSGEGADELFGGYWWFHDEKARDAQAFPWLYAMMGQARQERPYGPPELMAALDIPGFAEQAYRDAIAGAPVVAGASAEENRWRQQLYLHLTYHLQYLLDRKDRISMAVGLEVRVPFCDHRLVELAFNLPYALQVADGREKSVLRAAVADVLPDSIVGRVKSPYPRNQDIDYVRTIQKQLREAVAEDSAGLSALAGPGWTAQALERPAEHVDPGTRMAIERALDLDVWLRHYRPALILN